MKRIKFFITLLAASALVEIMAGCGAPTLAHSRYTYNTAITVSVNPVTNINPVTEVGSVNNLYSQLVYGTLATFNPDGIVTPLLAKSWTGNRNYTEYQFSLNPYAKWWTGRPVTASDIAWTLTFYRNPSNGAYRARELRLVKSIRVLSATKLQVTLTHPDPEFVADTLTARGRLWILPSFLLDHLKPGHVKTSDFLNKIRNVVGTGPYRPLRFSATGLRFEANPHYDLGAPKVKYLRWQWYPAVNESLSQRHITLALSQAPIRNAFNYRTMRLLSPDEWDLTINARGLGVSTTTLKAIIVDATHFSSLGGLSLEGRSSASALSRVLTHAGYRRMKSGWENSSGTVFTVTLGEARVPGAVTIANALALQWQKAGIVVDTMPSLTYRGNNLNLISVSAMDSGHRGPELLPLMRPYEYWYSARNLVQFTPNSWAPFEEVQKWRILTRENRPRGNHKKHR